MKFLTDEQRYWFGLGLTLAAALACLLLVIVPSFASRQSDAPDCRIVGHVYGAEDPEEVGAVLLVPAGCPIDVARFERRLVLTSPRWRVEIEIPRALGWQEFRYRWGQDRAYIGPHEVPIVASPRERPA